MEQFENPYATPSPESVESPGGVANDQVRLAVAEEFTKTRPWLVLLGVMLIVIAAFMLGGICLILVTTKGRVIVPLVIVSFAFGIMSLLTFIAGMLTFSIRRAMTEFLSMRSDVRFERAVRTQNTFWKFCAIVGIIYLALLVFIVVQSWIRLQELM